MNKCSLIYTQYNSNYVILPFSRRYEHHYAMLINVETDAKHALMDGIHATHHNSKLNDHSEVR